MRGTLAQVQDRQGPLGIRKGIWIFVCTLLLFTGIAIKLSRPGALSFPSRGASLPETASATQQAGVQFQARTRRDARPIRRILNAEAAADLARQMANETAKELYDCEPFREMRPARMEEAKWIWSDCRTWGHADFEATVTLGQDGSPQSVQVLLLDSGRAFRATMP